MLHQVDYFWYGLETVVLYLSKKSKNFANKKIKFSLQVFFNMKNMLSSSNQRRSQTFELWKSQIYIEANYIKNFYKEWVIHNFKPIYSIEEGSNASSFTYLIMPHILYLRFQSSNYQSEPFNTIFILKYEWR